MNVSVNLLENHHNETGFMPLSQHVHSSTHSKQLHLLAPSSGIQKRPKFIPIKKKNGYSNGFPLLRLESHYHIKPALLYPTEMTSAFSRPPPVPRVAWGSSDSIGNYQASYTPRQSESEADLNMSRYDPEIPGRMHKEEKRWAEVVHKEPPKHLNLDQYEGHQGVSPQQQFFANVNVDKAQITQNLGGIPLLRLDPAPRLPAVVRQPVTTTLGPIKPTTK
ncbi:CPLN1 protein, partial [Piaya cayana]|nr:CPLN1 protein [Piaya cayana]